jgi:hypothetical protein
VASTGLMTFALEKVEKNLPFKFGANYSLKQKKLNTGFLYQIHGSLWYVSDTFQKSNTFVVIDNIFTIFPLDKKSSQ